MYLMIDSFIIVSFLWFILQKCLKSKEESHVSTDDRRREVMLAEMD